MALRFCSFLCFPIICRELTYYFFENLTEILGIGIPDLRRDLVELQLRSQ